MGLKEALGLDDKKNEGLDEDYAAQLLAAKRDWENAQAYFESVSDSELVDFAIFDMEAARLRYIYLLRKIRAAWDKGTA